MNEVNTPMVSIVCTTFNHANHIAKTLEGFLIQKVDFQFEILIFDDASTDGTSEVIRSFEKEHSDLIKPIYAERNQYSLGKKTWMFGLERARGKYIAMCEGDDYWTDPLKLQRQVDYLESHDQAAGCFHDVNTVDDNDKEIESNYFRPSRESYSQEQCLKELKSSYGTCSLLFRRKILDGPLPGWFQQALCDEILDLYITEFGSLDYLPGQMASYRIHSTGSWQGVNEYQRVKQMIARFRILYADNELSRRYEPYLKKKINKSIYRIIHNTTGHVRAKLLLIPLSFRTSDHNSIKREWRLIRAIFGN